MVVWLCAAAFLPLGCLEAYSRGAPDSQCRYMTPKHGFQPQNADPRDDIPAWVQVGLAMYLMIVLHVMRGLKSGSRGAL